MLEQEEVELGRLRNADHLWKANVATLHARQEEAEQLIKELRKKLTAAEQETLITWHRERGLQIEAAAEASRRLLFCTTAAVVVTFLICCALGSLR